MAAPAKQHNLILILARNFASRLATAVFLVDAEGSIIYYNEAAERLLGQRFIEGHGMTAAEYTKLFQPSDDAGNPIDVLETPLGVAITRQQPEHAKLTIRGADGVMRPIEATAFPLLAHTNECVGAIAIFWERSEDG
jgi:PAS domain S-box-containing protein